MIYLPRQKTLFVHVPKTGGEYVAKMLENVPGWRNPNSRGGKHCPFWMVKEDVQHRFAFIRRPVSWYKSLYWFTRNNFFIPHGRFPNWEPGVWHPQRVLQRLWERGALDMESFDGFVRTIYEHIPAYYTRMVEWQVGPLDAGAVRLFKQENLNRELAGLFDEWGFPGHAERTRNDKNRVNATGGKREDISDASRHAILENEKNIEELYRLKHEDIQGWYDWHGLVERLARDIPRGARYLEIGVWKGKSMVAFLQATEHLNTTAVGVDLFGGKQDDPTMDRIVENEGGDFMPAALRNLKDAGVDGRCRLVREDSRDYAHRIGDGAFDIILIDALHSYDSVLADTKAYLPKLKRGGYMLWHDADREDVRRAISDAGCDFAIEKPRTAYWRKP